MLLLVALLASMAEFRIKSLTSNTQSPNLNARFRVALMELLICHINVIRTTKRFKNGVLESKIDSKSINTIYLLISNLYEKKSIDENRKKRKLC